MKFYLWVLICELIAVRLYSVSLQLWYFILWAYIFRDNLCDYILWAISEIICGVLFCELLSVSLYSVSLYLWDYIPWDYISQCEIWYIDWNQQWQGSLRTGVRPPDKNVLLKFMLLFVNQNICCEYWRIYTTRYFLPFYSQGQGPVEFGEISFEPSKLGRLDSIKKKLDLHFRLSDLKP